MSGRASWRRLSAAACLLTGGLAAWSAAAGALALRPALALATPTQAAATTAPPAPPTPGALALTPAVRLAPAAAGSAAGDTADAWLHEAVALHRQGRIAAAIKAYRQAIAQPGAPAAAHLGLARLEAVAGGPAAAARYLVAAHDRAPDPALAVEAGRWWAAAGEADLACVWLERSLPVHSAEDSALLAALHLLAGRHEQAVAAYRHALRQPQGRAAWWLGLGWALQALGDVAGARTAYQRALAGEDLPAAASRHVVALLERDEG